MEVERYMSNEEASHYQSGIFTGIKAHVGMGVGMWADTEIVKI